MDDRFQAPDNFDWREGKNTAECNRYMLEHELHCDVTFIVGSGKEKQPILAHKYILISRSEVFEAMLVGLLHEHSNNIEIPDVYPAAFRRLLEFMYYDQTRLDEQDAYELLYVARKYLVTDLVRRCLQRLKTRMSVENVCIILSYADDEGTVKLCLDYIFRYSLEVLKSDGFKELSPEHIKSIISNNRLGVREEDIFDAVILWSERECQRQEIDILPENQWKVLGDILKLIRYGRMDRAYLLNVCKKFLPQDLYIDIVENIASHIEENPHQGSESLNLPRPLGTSRGVHSQFLTCGAEVRPKEYLRPHNEVLDGTNVSVDGELDCATSGNDRNVSEMEQIPSVFTHRSDRFEIYRFAKNSYVRGKTYDMHTPESISFLTLQNVNLCSIYLYGSCEGEGDYHIHLEIFEDLGGQLSLMHSSERDITTNGSTSPYEFDLEPSIRIQSERVYTIRALFEGPPSYFGTNGISNVFKNGVSVFFITNDELGLNLTTSEGGQFPGLLFER
ncbi:BTB/POZ domain-containing protein 2-like [Mytilus californianus]|uniref:BTB/POZ domain-containing protein 2-like n=1 Tax=Mytilus californianus TaxID=6549 RepID=UPI0022480A8D|nr:BTB/POZ domain-containing protein 2-like [Mytilus californianus]XP_052072470.1 BTB/POZ domain-containing protein 2-like [Mytilus californianus]XP_052072471.1 BTB/POZ domain-containing protein 2-like [Mytilus californianus]XP_052072472.1 BTB/POZ domain-containing protein 2-like [Mytilus californianus]XP_052072473.1 BTB/POZ domain-containing protein 2-like [Mytilus californianus]XP_052072474.1 BTB/POZ domain-containing protein 2-like [Mytilus californianus]